MYRYCSSDLCCNVAEDYSDYCRKCIVKQICQLLGMADNTETVSAVIDHTNLPEFMAYYRQHGPQSCYIYTGRGPSTPDMHLGHVLQFMIIGKLQRHLGVRVKVLLADYEKYLFRSQGQGSTDIDLYTQYAERCQTQISRYLCPELTDYYIGTRDIALFYRAILRVERAVTRENMHSCFGHDYLYDAEHNDGNIGQIPSVAYQVSLCDPKVFNIEGGRCLVICASDQEPYFSLADLCAEAVGMPQPSVLYLDQLPSITGQGKMNSTPEHGETESQHQNNVIFVTDNEETIRKKLAGASPEVISKYLEYFGSYSTEEDSYLSNIDRCARAIIAVCAQ